MDHSRPSGPSALYHTLGRIEGKIDGFTTQLSEHRNRVDLIERIVGETARKVAVLDERTSTLEERPDPSGDISAIKSRLTYATGVIAAGAAGLTFAAPYIVKLIWGL